MYRIELAPGEETVYRTIEELAVGFRNGLVTSRSRIYHNATQKWLPIEFHPHYKKAIELSAHRQELPSAAPLPERLDTLNFAVPRPAVPAPPPPPPEPEPVAPEPVVAAPVAHVPAAPAPMAQAPMAQAPVGQAPVAQSRVAPARVAPASVAPAPVAPAPVAHAPSPAPRVEAAPVRRYEPPVFKTSAGRRSAEIAPQSPILFFAAPAAVEEEPEEHRAPEPSLPPVVASPVLQFPTIVYPEITPAEAPVAETVTASSRSRRPLHVAGAIVVLALGAYGMLSFASATRPAPATVAEPNGPAFSAPLSQPPVPAAAEPASDETPVKQVVMTQPASSGFAPALEPRAIVSSSAATRPAGVPANDSSLAPAPVDIELDVPALPAGDSLVAPTVRSDSAIKKILRAVNGGKDLPPRP